MEKSVLTDQRFDCRQAIKHLKRHRTTFPQHYTEFESRFLGDIEDLLVKGRVLTMSQLVTTERIYRKHFRMFKPVGGKLRRI